MRLGFSSIRSHGHRAGLGDLVLSGWGALIYILRSTRLGLGLGFGSGYRRVSDDCGPSWREGIGVLIGIDWDVLSGGNCTFSDEKITDVNDR